MAKRVEESTEALARQHEGQEGAHSQTAKQTDPPAFGKRNPADSASGSCLHVRDPFHGLDCSRQTANGRCGTRQEREMPAGSVRRNLLGKTEPHAQNVGALLEACEHAVDGRGRESRGDVDTNLVRRDPAGLQSRCRREKEEGHERREEQEDGQESKREQDSASHSDRPKKLALKVDRKSVV